MSTRELRFHADQRFTCRQCGRCCRRGWEIVVLDAERQRYREAGVERLFRETEVGPDGASRDPFERLPGHAGYSRIRKRPDGACGFLSPDDRCRLHEALGAENKPLTCRLYPFRFHPGALGDIATVSFSCPTVVADHGSRLASQASDLRALRRAWFDAHPEPGRPVELVKGRRLPAAALRVLREVLSEMIERPGTEGVPDVRANVRRVAHTLEDLARHRVRRLDDAALTEYVALTGRFAARSDKPVPARPPTRLGRRLARGFLFAVCAGDVIRRDGRTRGLRLSLRCELFALLAHLHGIGPPAGGFDTGLAERASLDPNAPGLWPVAHRYLRSAVETLGTARVPVLDELAVSVAYLNAAGSLAALRAARAGRSRVEPDDYEAGLLEASDLSLAEDRGLLGRLLTTLAGGAEALFVFAAHGRG